MLRTALQCAVLMYIIGNHTSYGFQSGAQMIYQKNPAPDSHRCGVCPTYFQKICGFDYNTNLTSIFDNHCIMDLYNCIHGTDYRSLNYEECLYFGNFAYVHGLKYADQDYDEDHVIVMGAHKNPDFV